MIPGITKAGSTIDRGVSMIIYADPGKGKTTCAARLPVGETLIINVEAGLGPLLGTNHYKFEMTRDLKDLAAIYKFLNVEKHPFKWIVIDNLSELQEWMVLSLTAMRKKDFAELREKGDAASKMREYLYNFRNLIDRDINVVFNAWEMPFNFEKGADGDKTKICPKIYPSLAMEACGIVDLVGHLEVYEKSGDRYIRFEGNDTMVAKSQYRGVDKFEPANLLDIVTKIKKFNYAKAKPIAQATAEEVKLIKETS
jgi:phage nucleotide-binding protein